MAVMDIVIVPSRFEGFGLTAAEAMAAGKPVIASGCFGLEEIVVNKKTGLLFTPGNFSDLAEKLEWLIGSPVLCTNLGIQGKKRVESVFGMDKFTVKISSLYKAFRN
jgi:glycosyltransferase involved in cell wall biosynthesis